MPHKRIPSSLNNAFPGILARALFSARTLFDNVRHWRIITNKLWCVWRNIIPPSRAAPLRTGAIPRIRREAPSGVSAARAIGIAGAAARTSQATRVVWPTAPWPHLPADRPARDFRIPRWQMNLSETHRRNCFLYKLYFLFLTIFRKLQGICFLCCE